MDCFIKTSHPILLQPLLFNDLDGVTDNGLSPRVDGDTTNQVVDELQSRSPRFKRSAYLPYGYGYSYYGARGYGSGYGSGVRYGGCYNCYPRPRPLARALLVGGAAFTCHL